MKALSRLLAGLVLSCLAVAAALFVWLDRPLSLAAERVETSIEPGMNADAAAAAWQQAGVQEPLWLMQQWFRWSGKARQIRAGSYEIRQGESPRGLLDRMVRGDETLERVRLIEGWSLRQVRQALSQAPGLRQTLSGTDDAQLARLLALPPEVASAEGWLFPDTYAYSRGASDLLVLRRAARAMQRQLDRAWAQRRADLPLQSPTQLLTLASVVEKETGAAPDRPHIAGVFANRLRIGMPLQSDPTVIYGLGERFDGNLRRTDLTTDTPWNTYTRRGLPPTPIALPGQAALMATAQPASTRALYFVARGDGSSAFSETLDDHNRAVNQYQRGLGR